MHNLTEYSDNYLRTSGSLYQFCMVNPKIPIIDSESFKIISRSLNNTNDASTVKTEIAVPLEYLSNF